MPIEHQPGAIATFRNVPQATRDAIGSLAMILKTTGGDVIAAAVAGYVEMLNREGRLPERWDRLVERQALAGVEERVAEVADRRRRAVKGKTSVGAGDAAHVH